MFRANLTAATVLDLFGQVIKRLTKIAELVINRVRVLGGGQHTQPNFFLEYLPSPPPPTPVTLLNVFSMIFIILWFMTKLNFVPRAYGVFRLNMSLLFYNNNKVYLNCKKIPLFQIKQEIN